MRVRDLATQARSEIHPAAAFVFIGQQPNSGFVRSFVETDPAGFIPAEHDLVHGREPRAGREPFAFETSRPGVFAAGDVRRGSVKQVASAIGEGAAAAIAIAIHEYLRTV